MDLDRIERTLSEFNASLLEASKLRQNRAAQESVKLQAPLARRILDSLEPDLGNFKIGGMSGWTPAREATLHGLGLVAARREGDEWFRPDSPILDLGSLHDLVWNPASTYWNMQDRPRAVEAAYRAVQAQIQHLIGRTDLDGTALYEQAFSPNPREGSIRLWLNGNRSTETWKSRQQGLMRLGQSAALGIRNVLAHTEKELTPLEAIENLATLSLLARWVDDTEPTGTINRANQPGGE
jgi:uncharacterized protein (TIGR02391 family)